MDDSLWKKHRGDVISLSILLIGGGIVISGADKIDTLSWELKDRTFALETKITSLENRLENIEKPKTIAPMDLSDVSKKWIEGYKAACKRAKDILVNQSDKLYEREGRQVMDDAWLAIDALEKNAFANMPTVISDEKESAPLEEVGPGLLQALEHNEKKNSDKLPPTD